MDKSEGTLIVLSGLPGVGKTTIAKRLVNKLSALFLRIDTLEQALKHSDASVSSSSDAGYRAAIAIADDNLEAGRVVVADGVNLDVRAISAWQNTAERNGSGFFYIRLVCSDETEHRRRVENRKPDIKGHMLPDWQDVKRHQQYHETAADLVIDTATITIDQAVTDIQKLITDA